MGKRFSNPVIVQGIESADGRIIHEVGFRELPLSVRWVRQDVGAHQGAEAVGVFDGTNFDGEHLHIGMGEYLDTPTAQDAAALVDGGAQFFSADPGGRIEYHFTVLDPDGKEVTPKEIDEAYYKMYYGTDDESKDAKAWLQSLRERQEFDFYEVGGITQVDIPAFPECRIAWVAEGTDAGAGGAGAEQAGRDLTSAEMARSRKLLRRVAAVPTVRPAAAFAKRTFTSYTPWSVDDKGQIFGHVAGWNSCHRGFQNRCERPQYQTAFDEFHIGWTPLDDGTRIRTGVITHVDGHLTSFEEYRRHAEDPLAQLGPVRLYADEWGIQACGVVHADIPQAQLDRAVAGQPSGDWIGVEGQRTLRGIAIVNTPGHLAYGEEYDDGTGRLVAAIPPPSGLGEQVPVSGAFWSAPPEVITAACACQAPAAEPEATSTASDEHHDCGCGGEAGACTCDAPKLTAKDLLDMAQLDAAVKVITSA